MKLFSFHHHQRLSTPTIKTDGEGEELVFHSQQPALHKTIYPFVTCSAHATHDGQDGQPPGFLRLFPILWPFMQHHGEGERPHQDQNGVAPDTSLRLFPSRPPSGTAISTTPSNVQRSRHIIPWPRSCTPDSAPAPASLGNSQPVPCSLMSILYITQARPRPRLCPSDSSRATLDLDHLNLTTPWTRTAAPSASRPPTPTRPSGCSSASRAPFSLSASDADTTSPRSGGTTACSACHGSCSSWEAPSSAASSPSARPPTTAPTPPRSTFSSSTTHPSP